MLNGGSQFFGISLFAGSKVTIEDGDIAGLGAGNGETVTENRLGLLPFCG